MTPGSAARRQGCKEAVNCEGAAPPSCSWRWRNEARNPAACEWQVIPDFKTTTLTNFIVQHIAPGSTIYTDGLKQFAPPAGFKHVPRTQPVRAELRKGAKSVVPLADRAIGNLHQ